MDFQVELTSRERVFIILAQLLDGKEWISIKLEETGDQYGLKYWTFAKYINEFYEIGLIQRRYGKSSGTGRIGSDGKEIYIRTSSLFRWNQEIPCNSLQDIESVMNNHCASLQVVAAHRKCVNDFSCHFKTGVNSLVYNKNIPQEEPSYTHCDEEPHRAPNTNCDIDTSCELNRSRSLDAPVAQNPSNTVNKETHTVPVEVELKKNNTIHPAEPIPAKPLKEKKPMNSPEEQKKVDALIETELEKIKAEKEEINKTENSKYSIDGVPQRYETMIDYLPNWNKKGV